MNILDFVRAIARTIDRGLGTKVASELVVRLKDGLNRNGRLLEVRCALSTALTLSDASDVLVESHFSESCSASARRFGELFLSFPFSSLGEVVSPWRWEDHPHEVRRVLGLFTEFVAILALRNSSRYFTELTIGRMREDIARRSQNAWKMALDPEHPTLLRRVITSLTEEEVGRLQRELMEVTIDLSMKQHPEPSTNLFVQPSRGRKGPPN